MRVKGKTLQELVAENRSEIQKDPIKMDRIEDRLEKKWMAWQARK
ncbi:FbpB family small basic protein [Jeotgalibacillus sp. S-D1]|nr:FbpB family small basic protein [Jeotgalibacillus sp. S-D1]